MTGQIQDLVVIGGGINGAGIALDAAGRGLSVTLCEMNDLASATSSASSKLIHGGLRYLEHGEFRLVREALAERERLLSSAPHIIWPLRFRLPHRPHLRPAWMIRLGLWLYDHLARRDRLPASQSLRLDRHSPLVSDIQRAFEYSDAWVDDARLVVLCAMAAHERGADIRLHTRCSHAERQRSLWQLTLTDQHGRQQTLRARALVNAAGPWASALFDEVLPAPAPARLRLVKGSHIIVPRLHDGPEAWILQHDDGRIVFVLPYEQHFSLIGTTDEDYRGDPADVCASKKEIAYLCTVVNAHFRHKISPADVIRHYAGVRPLMAATGDKAQRASRDYRLIMDDAAEQAPLLSVFGGKITTFRALAEDALNQLSRVFPAASGPWTSELVLPGGNFEDHASLQQALKRQYPWLPAALVARYVRSYGTLCRRFLAGCTSIDSLGEHFGAGLYGRELEYLVRDEWARCADDVLWRRSKLGLFLSDRQQRRLADWLDGHVPPVSASGAAKQGLWLSGTGQQ